MKLILSGHNLADTYFLKGLLDAEGITSEVHNEFLNIGGDKIPSRPDTQLQLWIIDDSQFDQAINIVNRYEQGEDSIKFNKSSWHCPKCGELLEGQFTICWQCGSDRPI
jgi:hypothetical protein